MPSQCFRMKTSGKLLLVDFWSQVELQLSEVTNVVFDNERGVSRETEGNLVTEGSGLVEGVEEGEGEGVAHWLVHVDQNLL